MTSSEPKPEKNWEALEQAVQSIRELGPVARRAGAEWMRERAADHLEGLGYMWLAGKIRALPLEEPK